MRVLIVEDERTLADALARGLRREGHTVDITYDGRTALDTLEDIEPDVIILDRDLPLVHGDIVCRTIVNDGLPARILMLTASDAVEDVVHGLELGADDYLAKPFAYAELLARLDALVRRSPSRTLAAREVIVVGQLRIDLRRAMVEEDGMPIHLTRREFAVVRELLMADGAPLSSTALLDRVLGVAAGSHDRCRQGDHPCHSTEADVTGPH